MKIQYCLLIVLLQIWQSSANFSAFENLTIPEVLDYFKEYNDYLKNNNDLTHLIFPGTKYCGPGNISNSDDDFGIFVNVDKCCYDHDRCDNILPGETKYGLTNNSTYAILDCSCDENFKECLKQEKCKIGKTVGCLYFLGQEKCYKNEYPIVKCHRYDNKVFQKRCVEYQLDKTKEKEYQYFDLPFFKSKS